MAEQVVNLGPCECCRAEGCTRIDAGCCCYHANSLVRMSLADITVDDPDAQAAIDGLPADLGVNRIVSDEDSPGPAEWYAENTVNGVRAELLVQKPFTPDPDSNRFWRVELDVNGSLVFGLNVRDAPNNCRDLFSEDENYTIQVDGRNYRRQGVFSGEVRENNCCQSYGEGDCTEIEDPPPLRPGGCTGSCPVSCGECLFSPDVPLAYEERVYECIYSDDACQNEQSTELVVDKGSVPFSYATADRVVWEAGIPENDDDHGVRRYHYEDRVDGCRGEPNGPARPRDPDRETKIDIAIRYICATGEFEIVKSYYENRFNDFVRRDRYSFSGQGEAGVGSRRHGIPQGSHDCSGGQYNIDICSNGFIRYYAETLAVTPVGSAP